MEYTWPSRLSLLLSCMPLALVYLLVQKMYLGVFDSTFNMKLLITETIYNYIKLRENLINIITIFVQLNSFFLINNPEDNMY